jgi:hypothetical protein
VCQHLQDKDFVVDNDEGSINKWVIWSSNNHSGTWGKGKRAFQAIYTNRAKNNNVLMT